MTGYYAAGFIHPPDEPTESVVLYSTPCWVCGERAVFSINHPIPLSRTFSTVRSVRCPPCAVEWHVKVHSVDGRVVVVEE